METTYVSSSLCLIDKDDSVVFWLPRGLKYSSCRAMAELGDRALGLFDIDVLYRAKSRSLIISEESSKHRVYPDVTQGLVNSSNSVVLLFRRGELFKRTMAIAEDMGLSVHKIQIEVTETLSTLSRKENGDFKFFEDFRKG